MNIDIDVAREVTQSHRWMEDAGVGDGDAPGEDGRRASVVKHVDADEDVAI